MDNMDNNDKFGGLFPENVSVEDKKNLCSRISYGYFFLVALIVVVFTVCAFLGVFRGEQSKGEQLFMEHFKPYVIDVKVRMVDACSELDKAINLYKAGNTTMAFEEFDRLKFDNSELCGFFSALCQIELGHFAKAQKELESIRGNAVFYVDHIDWYLALCYLKLEHIAEAKIILTKIAAGENSYSQKAGVILQRLK